MGASSELTTKSKKILRVEPEISKTVNHFRNQSISMASVALGELIECKTCQKKRSKTVKNGKTAKSFNFVQNQRCVTSTIFDPEILEKY